MEEEVKWITSLVDRYLRAELTEGEKQELSRWLNESESNQSWFNEIIDKEKLAGKLQEYANFAGESIWQKTVNKINSDATVVRMHPVSGSWKRYVIAASVLVVISTAAWMVLVNNPKKDIAEKKGSVNPEKIVIVPGSKKAVLTLGDGSGIALDKVQNGTIAKQGKTEIIKRDGEILYNAEYVAEDNEVVYNTITTPKGGDYMAILPDGSKVWLNAASSLRFPIVFAGNYRNVQLTGEAYFEVSRNAAKPFSIDIMKNGHLESSVKVLGTHFDVQAYNDEKNIETSLLQGLVQVSAVNQDLSRTSAIKRIKPGQQAQVRDGSIKVIEPANLKNVVAWTEGYMSLEGPNANIGSIMRQIGRWYNVDVEFKDQNQSRTFTGKLPRNLPLKDLIEILNYNNIRVKLEGNKLIVTP
jgi:ferric-dicitrate binding protein FerR (iron transport regulator)